MGLTETIDETTLEPNKKDDNGNIISNNLDVHMEKNTEYGALAILSASDYGNPNHIADGDTTTGNATGVVMKINGELVAAGKVLNATNYKNANEKYKNIYNGVLSRQSGDRKNLTFVGTYVKASDNGSGYDFRRGDAITETEGWHRNRFK